MFCLTSLFAFLPVLVSAEEVCLWETFNASCSARQVVFIETAFYGRTNNSRCFNVTENEADCFVDIRQDMQKHFGVKQHIQVKLASEYFTTKSITCLNARMPFLEVSHQCTNCKSAFIKSKLSFTLNEMRP